MRYVGTTTALGASATFTSADMMSNTEDSIVGTVFSDQGGTLLIEQGYPDDTGVVQYDVSTSYSISGGDGKGFTEPIVAPKWRLSYTNGGTDQTTFRLYARATSTGDS